MGEQCHRARVGTTIEEAAGEAIDLSREFFYSEKERKKFLSLWFLKNKSTWSRRFRSRDA
jgi:hypothetical protein